MANHTNHNHNHNHNNIDNKFIYKSSIEALIIVILFIGVYFLTKNSHLRGWGCEGKWGSFDVTPNLYAFPCFPYSSRSYRQKIKSKENIVNLNKKLKKSLKKCLK